MTTSSKHNNKQIKALQARYQHLTARECRNPRLAIKAVFSENDMPEERQRLEEWLQCAFSAQRLSEVQMVFIPKLHFNLLRLLDAAALLAKANDWHELNGPYVFEAHEPCWYFKRQHIDQVTACYYPRYLPLEQFINPYRVINACGLGLPSTRWKALLSAMLTAANSGKTIHDISPDKHAYGHCHALLQLLEAGYLVYVRETQKPAEIGKGYTYK